MLIKLRCCLAVLVVATVVPPSTHAFVTKTVTTEPSSAVVEYGYTVPTLPPSGASTYNDFHVRFERIDRIDTLTATNSGGAAGFYSTAPVPGCPYPCGELVFKTAFGLGFGAPATFSVKSIGDPRFIEGPQQIRFTRDGAEKLVVTSGVTTGGHFVPYSTTASFSSGTFPAGSTIDLLQTPPIPTESVFIGTGTATGTGSASIALSRPLAPVPLYASIDASSSLMFLVAASAPMLNAWSIALLALALTLAMVRVLRTRRRSTS